MSELTITASTVRKLVIQGAYRLDPVCVMLEDFGEGQGSITITCWGSAWHNFWGAMGKQHTIASFFAKASVGYLAAKLKNGMPEAISDQESLDEGCRKEVIKQRRAGDIDKGDARELWEGIESACFDAPLSDNSGLFTDIFGEEWWRCLPERPNPEYVYLCRIIEAVKEGLRQHAAMAVTQPSKKEE